MSNNQASDPSSMGDAFRSAANLSEAEQLAQIDTYLAHMVSLGYDKIEGPILQMAKATIKDGRRDEMLEILKQFRSIVEGEDAVPMFGYFPDIDDPNVIHCVQVYADWEALCHHMREPRYMQFVDPVMELAAPGSPEYSYGSCLFYHRGKGTGAAGR